MQGELSKREAISQIKSLFKKVNSDARLPNKLVWSLLKKHSLWIIKRESDNLKLQNFYGLFQIKKCIKVIQAPSIDSCCGLRMKDCKIYRTAEKLPAIYEDTAGIILKDVTSIDGYTTIDVYSPKAYKRLLSNPFSSKSEIRAFYGDGYLYFPDRHFKEINVEALFIDEVDNSSCEPCKDCDKTSCKKYLDSRWILPSYLQAQVIEYVIKDLSNTFIKLPEGSHTINKNDNK